MSAVIVSLGVALQGFREARFSPRFSTASPVSASQPFRRRPVCPPGRPSRLRSKRPYCPATARPQRLANGQSRRPRRVDLLSTAMAFAPRPAPWEIRRFPPSASVRSLRGKHQVFLFLAVEGADRARIKSSQSASGEIILDLGFDGLDRGGGRSGARRPAAGFRARFPPPPPVRVRLASAKNRRARAWLNPGLPLRSVSPPRHLMISSITSLIAGSLAASAGTMPSPFNFVCANIFAVSAVSSTVIPDASAFPR